MTKRIQSKIILFLVLLLCVLLCGCSQNAAESDEPAAEQKDPKTAKIEEIRSAMSDEEAAGQLFLARVPETDQTADIEAYNLGGYLIFGRDVEGETAESLTQKIQSWQAASKIPMLIGSDEEGGDVTRVSQILPEAFKGPGELYAEGGLDAVIQDAAAKSETLKGLGINLNLAPVADVALSPESFIYGRTLMLSSENLGEAAETTAEYVRGVVGAMKTAGIGCSLKHFPGYGENGDTHTDIITDTRELPQLESIDFIPFKAGIEAGAGSIMISHNIAVALDPDQPASISPKVHDVLRHDLGFNGVILTDDLDMAGLADFTDQESAAVKTVNAGSDLIISSSYSSQIPALLSALEDGSLPRGRFEEAVSHVLGWKYDLDLLN